MHGRDDTGARLIVGGLGDTISIVDPSALRIIDANVNRAGEGLRVLEEYARFVLEDEGASARLKDLRHALAEIARALGTTSLLSARDTRHDVGTGISTDAEQHRATPAEVAVAAARRAAEALRCIEEYGKLVDRSTAARVERLRYELYDVEQTIVMGSPRRAALNKARLHVIVTEARCAGPWLTVCEQAIAGGADILQLREQSLGDRELLVRARRLRAVTRERNVLMIVNDRVDVARLSDADGVHVGQEDVSVADARRIVGPHALVGKSTHGTAEARAALDERPDYIAVGPMFPSQTKSGLTVQGPTLLAEVSAFADVPVVAIGGIAAHNIEALDVQDRVQVAVCQSVIGAADPARAARGLKDRLDRA